MNRDEQIETLAQIDRWCRFASVVFRCIVVVAVVAAVAGCETEAAANSSSGYFATIGKCEVCGGNVKNHRYVEFDNDIDVLAIYHIGCKDHGTNTPLPIEPPPPPPPRETPEQELARLIPLLREAEETLNATKRSFENRHAWRKAEYDHNYLYMRVRALEIRHSSKGSDPDPEKWEQRCNEASRAPCQPNYKEYDFIREHSFGGTI